MLVALAFDAWKAGSVGTSLEWFVVIQWQAALTLKGQNMQGNLINE